MAASNRTVIRPIVFALTMWNLIAPLFGESFFLLGINVVCLYAYGAFFITFGVYAFSIPTILESTEYSDAVGKAITTTFIMGGIENIIRTGRRMTIDGTITILIGVFLQRHIH